MIFWSKQSAERADLTEIWFGISFVTLRAESTARAQEEASVFIA
jgi:hypothetical protein